MTTLFISFSDHKWKIDHSCDDGRRMNISITPWFEPFENDQEVHVTKDQNQEYQLWNGFEPELYFSFVI